MAKRKFKNIEDYLNNNGSPIATREQIKDSIRRLVISGAMEENEKLPSVRNLAVTLSINPNTIQRAYNELENEGYIYSIPGKGNFVSPSVSRDEGRVMELKKKLVEILAELKYLGITYEELEEILRETMTA